MNILELIARENWDIKELSSSGEKYVELYGIRFPVTHPVAIHLKLYRVMTNPETKYTHMKAAHDYLWPDTVWHYWTEERFREHCDHWKCITYASGASTGKSYDAAKIGDMFWLAYPKHRAVLVASTTLASLDARIYGYMKKLLLEMKVPLSFQIYGGNNPRVGLPKSTDKLHNIVAVAAKQGESEKAISSLIGRHPDEGLMVIMDEGTDMPMTLLDAVPNWKKGVKTFQMMAIGNSNSKYDLHGALSTPAGGWDSIDPVKDTKWETRQPEGLCIFFSCYNSPAIHEPDGEKKTRLSEFLITKKQIDEDIQKYGKDSDSFWRFTLGFWRTDSSDSVVISKKFLSAYDIHRRAEWSGLYPLSVVGGLDPAYSTGGDQCVLRLGLLGVDVRGKIVLDYRREDLLFRIRISAVAKVDAELQIADQVIDILLQHGCDLGNVCIDANGQGRALGTVIHLRAQQKGINWLRPPIKIFSTKAITQELIKNGGGGSFDIVVKSNYELWFAFRDYFQHGQLFGIDYVTANQLTSRLVVDKHGKRILEWKNDFKRRMGAIMPSLAHSPDEADAAALVLQAAILQYGFTPGAEKNVRALDFHDIKLQTKQEEDARVEIQERRAPEANFDSDLTTYFPPFS